MLSWLEWLSGWPLMHPSFSSSNSCSIAVPYSSGPVQDYSGWAFVLPRELLTYMDMDNVCVQASKSYLHWVCNGDLNLDPLKVLWIMLVISGQIWTWEVGRKWVDTPLQNPFPPLPLSHPPQKKANQNQPTIKHYHQQQNQTTFSLYLQCDNELSGLLSTIIIELPICLGQEHF